MKKRKISKKSSVKKASRGAKKTPKKTVRKAAKRKAPRKAARKFTKRAAVKAVKRKVPKTLKKKAPKITRKSAPKRPAPVKAPEKITGKATESGFDVKIQNIVAFTELGKPIPLEMLLKKVENTEWQPEQFPGLVYKITDPRASALIFSQGKIVCTGTKSLDDLTEAMRKIVDRIRKAGIPMPKTYSTKVENIVASTKIKGDLNLDEIAFMLENSEYEPEQFPGLVYRISEPRVAFLLFTSGRIICAGAQNMESIHKALVKFRENLAAIGVKITPVKEV